MLFVSLATDAASPDRDKEDFAAVAGDTMILLDGARTPAGSESGCLHGVAWFTRHLGIRILAETTAEPRRTLIECLPTLRIHDLRHTATATLSAGADVLPVSRILGHATPTLTLSLYGHILDAGVFEAIARTDRRLTAPCEDSGEPASEERT